MKLSLLNRLAFNGIWRRRRLYFPYVLAVVLVMALEYVMVSLSTNEALRSHGKLMMILSLGTIISAFLSGLFILYANYFISKQRRKEFALYEVLGLEPKHLRYLIGVEQTSLWVIISLFSIPFGYALGALMFMLLNKLMRETGMTLMQYQFSPLAAGVVLVLLAVTLEITAIFTNLQLTRVQPAELFSKLKAGEGEPKSHWILLLFGLLSLGSGYTLALTTRGAFQSFNRLLLAVLLVAMATYLLYYSLSVIVLKFLKKNKKFYYRSVPFLSISGLLRRMTSSAFSLGSLSLLVGGLILTLGTTATLYLGMDQYVFLDMPRAYKFENVNHVTKLDPKKEARDFKQLREKIEKYGTIENDVYYHSAFLPIEKKGNSFYNIRETTSALSSYYLIAAPVKDYNKLYHKNFKLKKGEVYITTVPEKVGKTITFKGRHYQTKPLPETAIDRRIFGNTGVVLFSDEKELNQIVNPEQVSHTLYFDMKGDANLPFKDDLLQDKNNEDFLMAFQSRKETRRNFYRINGQFLFIGIVIGMVLFVGIVLMLYFKQISEGQEDRENYSIMTEMGLPNETIKATIRQQILWIFALPITVGVIHAIAATKIIFQILEGLGVSQLNTIFIGYGSVLVLLILVYFLVYQLTAKTYYHLIKRKSVY